MAKKKLKMELQMFGTETFDPDNVLLSEKPDGELYGKFNDLVLNDVKDDSIVTQLGKYEEMTGQEKTFTFQADGVSAYWVDEGEKIQTTKPTVASATMRAHKLGVIVVASREFLNYTWTEFFNEIRPQLAEAFRVKLDEAAVLGEDTPFANSIKLAIENSGNSVEGELTYDGILDAVDVLYDEDIEPNAFISKKQNRSILRKAVGENGEEIFDRGANTIDGMFVTDFASNGFEKGQLMAGDFDNLLYGIPYPISYKISEEGQLSTITNEDGSAVNLFEQELIAMRATMDVAIHILKDEAFVEITPPVEI